MKLHTAIALRNTPGNPGFFTTVPPAVTTVPVAWPRPETANIGIVAVAGQIHVVGNEDTNIHRMNMLFVRASDFSLLASVILAKDALGASTSHPERLTGFAENRVIPLPTGAAVDLPYIPVSKTEGLQVIISVLGKSPQFQDSRFEGTFTLSYTYILLDANGNPPLGPDNTVVVQTALLTADKPVNADTATVLVLQSDGSMRLAKITLATGAVTYTNVLTV